MSNERRIRPPAPLTVYELREWDGADGRSNRPNGFVTHRKTVAEEWAKSGTGRDYRTVDGILIDCLDDMPEAQEALAKKKALSKLTEEEKVLLGLKPKSFPLHRAGLTKLTTTPSTSYGKPFQEK